MPLADRLADSFDRFNRSLDWLGAHVDRPAAGSWISVADLTAADGAALVARHGAISARFGQGQRDVGAAYLMAWIAKAVAHPVAWSWLVDGLAPSLVPDEVALREYDGGWFDALAVGTVDADVGSGGELSGRLVDLLAPMVEALRPRAPIGYRGLWGAVADAIAAGTAHAAIHGGRPDSPAVLRAGAAIVEAARPPLPRHPGFTTVTLAGRPTVIARRSVCCLAYKTGMQFCTTCPVPAAQAGEQGPG
ncbi:MAG: hypothetical protein ACRD29_17350 [Acidimicrobiales bacterium]